MVNEGLQRLIIDHALMINVTCTESQESKWENLNTDMPHRSTAQIGLFQEYIMYEKHD